METIHTKLIDYINDHLNTNMDKVIFKPAYLKSDVGGAFEYYDRNTNNKFLLDSVDYTFVDYSTPIGSISAITNTYHEEGSITLTFGINFSKNPDEAISAAQEKMNELIAHSFQIVIGGKTYNVATNISPMAQRQSPLIFNGNTIVLIDWSVYYVISDAILGNSTKYEVEISDGVYEQLDLIVKSSGTGTNLIPTQTINDVEVGSINGGSGFMFNGSLLLDETKEFPKLLRDLIFKETNKPNELVKMKVTLGTEVMERFYIIENVSLNDSNGSPVILNFSLKVANKLLIQ